jgi:hypothetical protein
MNALRAGILAILVCTLLGLLVSGFVKWRRGPGPLPRAPVVIGFTLGVLVALQGVFQELTNG